ncbi:MAG: hypothetical protein WD469_03745 [Paenibacillaceae bacterium]
MMIISFLVSCVSTKSEISNLNTSRPEATSKAMDSNIVEKVVTPSVEDKVNGKLQEIEISLNQFIISLEHSDVDKFKELVSSKILIVIRHFLR